VPVPSFWFFRFRKVTQEIFSELDKTKPKDPIFPRHETESKEESEGGQGQPHLIVVGVDPWAHHPRVWGHGCPLASPLRLYKVSDVKTLNRSAFFLVKFRGAASVEDQFWGTEVSVPAPSRDGEVPPEASPSTPSTPPPSPSTLLFPRMRRE
jgi:hypothetical protein